MTSQCYLDQSIGCRLIFYYFLLSFLLSFLFISAQNYPNFNPTVAIPPSLIGHLVTQLDDYSSIDSILD